ncbi:MAG: tRNA (5-methylaminomethyl-2-thiouridine)(34)-methyltransferase MnmD, partial [Roseibium sp.]|uniref:tRNA (5-methylaminomethyl-2-thiouridine)(34)-methyltransferase MnmD n=1 Tax=Roseibium sp. TaxID=1936156 RepID=UPI00262E801A
APRLLFVSFELFPMTKTQLLRALGAFPELDMLSAELADVWDPVPGWNRMSVSGADLLLGIGDARELITQLTTADLTSPTDSVAVPPIDAWYLDGFSPAKNPELWDLALLQKVAGLTSGDGTLATYTAAGWVRRNLQSAGFVVDKISGFAGKREMVVGQKKVDPNAN